MAKPRKPHRLKTAGVTIDLTWYGDGARDQLNQLILEELTPVMAAMEQKAKSKCPVGTREVKQRKFQLNPIASRKYKSHPGSRSLRYRYQHPKRYNKNERGEGLGVFKVAKHENWRTREPGRLRDSIRGSAHIRKDGTAVVGFLEAGDEDAFYARFVEMGTYKMPAQPYLRPAVNEHREDVNNAVLNALRRMGDME